MSVPPADQRRASLGGELGDVAWVRRSVGEWLRGWGLDPLVEDVQLVASELTTNAILHAGGAVEVVVERRGDGVRVVVHDGRPDVVPTPPSPTMVRPGGDGSDGSRNGRVAGRTPGAGGANGAGSDQVDGPDGPGGAHGPDRADWADGVDGAEDDLERMARTLFERTTTGRGLLLVEAFADAWGVEVDSAAKGVWAEVGTGRSHRRASVMPAPVQPEGGLPVRLCSVPVRLVLYSAANLDELVRELQTTEFDESMPSELAVLGEQLALETAPQREPLRAAARLALQTRDRTIDIELQVPPEQADALCRLFGLTGQVEELCRAGVLLSGAPTPEVTEFRRWFVDEVARQVAGHPVTPCPFAD